MRDIASNRIRGHEAIMVAAVAWWVDTDPTLSDAVTASLETADPSAFRSMHERDLGEACGGRILEAEAAFWKKAGSDPGVKHMIEQAVLAWRVEGGTPAQMDAAREFVRRLVRGEAGRMVKSSGFLERNARAVKAARRRRR